jgi:ABC-type enterochelin transport system substrate-binding protein
MKPQPTLEDMMKQGVTRILNRKEIILAPIGKQMRIGWVYKDTGLPPTAEDIKQAKKENT